MPSSSNREPLVSRASARRAAWSCAFAAAAVIVATTASCAIQPDSSPKDIPQDELPPTEMIDPEAGASAGSSRIFLLTSDEDNGERQLRSVLRSVPDASPFAVLEELFRGPNSEEFEAGLRSGLPEGLELLSARSVAGTLNVDVSSDILELPAPALRLAVAEIVFTASELEGGRAVRLLVGGEIRGWPNGSGEQQNTPLSVYDYPGLAESAQPAYPPLPS